MLWEQPGFHRPSDHCVNPCINVFYRAYSYAQCLKLDQLQLDQLQNRCNEEKGKEKKKERGEGKEEERKKQRLQWWIQGRDPPLPLLIFRPNLGPKGPKKFIFVELF